MNKKIIILSFILTFIDQIVKNIVVYFMIPYKEITIIKDFFSLTYVQNTGAAWSILSGQRWLLIILAIGAINLIYLFMIKDKELSKIETIVLAMLMGGIIGNLVDRILYGYVIDYLDFNIFSYNYPVFNFADICIVISVILLFIMTIKDDIIEKNNS